MIVPEEMLIEMLILSRRVMEVQESKKDLAAVSFSGPDGEQGVSTPRLEVSQHQSTRILIRKAIPGT